MFGTHNEKIGFGEFGIHRTKHGLMNGKTEGEEQLQTKIANTSKDSELWRVMIAPPEGTQQIKRDGRKLYNI